MTKSELFTRACCINAFRKESQLPLRDIHEIAIEQESVLAWKEYARAVEKHRAVYDELLERVRQDYLRAGKRDIALSVGGQRLLAYHANTLFEMFLSSKGIIRPSIIGVHYSS